MEAIRSLIRDIPDFPKPGILFKDITPVLRDPGALGLCIDSIAGRFDHRKIDAVAGMESRGFIFGAAVAYKLGVGFTPIRKPGKLPFDTHRMDYALEYGTDALEMHVDGVLEGENVLVVDDLLATGGTAEAAAALIERAGGRVAGAAFVIELAFLGGRRRLEARGIDVFSLVSY